MSDVYPRSEEADILLLLEGTFPYVSGGVSSWINTLLQKFPNYKFAIVFLGSQQSDYTGFKYKLPANVVHFEAHFLFDPNEHYIPIETKPDKESFDRLTSVHDQFKNIEATDFCILGKALKESLIDKDQASIKDFLFSRQSWDYITESYRKNCPQISFLDYFWLVRNMHIPLYKVLSLINRLPKVKVVHSISTGYAGFLGSLLHHKYHYPFILTEHGIYVKERKIDLLQGQWTAVGNFVQQRETITQQYMTDQWINFFIILARFCYAAADPVISLFSDCQKRQIQDGASEAKTMIVPNGVNVTRDPPSKKSPASNNPVIGLIGRVVPIKDIKNLIRAMVLVKKMIPDAVAWIIGPTDEDPGYYTECKELVDVLGLKDQIIFKGMQQIANILPELDLLVLSSISEALPLVILEAFDAGVPVVATDVGACRELIYGFKEEDKTLGEAGIVVEIANADALANGIIAMLTDKIRWQEAQVAARKRVLQHYSMEQFVANYNHIYQKALAEWQG